MSQSINWQSPNGSILSFGVFQHSGNWNHVSGIYLFCRQELSGAYTPLYIGQAQSFRDRLPQHEQWNLAAQKGASTVLAALVPLQDSRDLLERQLIQEFQPELNTHHTNALVGLLGSR